MTYVSHLNGLIRDAVAATSNSVVFGQNVSAGSCLSGLTRGIDATTPASSIRRTWKTRWLGPASA